MKKLKRWLPYILVCIMWGSMIGYFIYEDHMEMVAIDKCITEQSLDVEKQDIIYCYCLQKVRKGEYK